MRHAFRRLCAGLTISACTAAPGQTPVVPRARAVASAAAGVIAANGAHGPAPAIASLPDVFHGDVAAHDPSFVRAPDGTFYVYSTHDLIQVRTCLRVTFSHQGTYRHVSSRRGTPGHSRQTLHVSPSGDMAAA